MDVVQLLRSVSGFAKIRFDKENIDNFVFKMHYQATAGILFAFSILCAANTLIGDPIDCIGTELKDRESMVDTYCWISSTYTLPHLLDQKTGKDTKILYPGVGTYEVGVDEEKYHTYYQWVPFVLFLQGLLFFAPHWLWKSWEDGKIRELTTELREKSIAVTETMKEKQKDIAQFIVNTLHLHNFYAYGYFLCEILNFANVIGNIYLVDRFLGGAFLRYGTEVIDFASRDQEYRTDPMVVIFPRVTKCILHKYGTSGTKEVHDFLCVLPVNILNEKIYIYLWFWFIILSVISGIALMYRAITIACPPVRKFLLQRHCKHNPSNVAPILQKSQLGDFVLLNFLGKNLSSTVFKQVLEDVEEMLADHKPRI